MDIVALRRSRWIFWIAACLLVVLAALGGIGWLVARRAEPWLHDCVVAGLEQRFKARVELDGFHVWFSDGLWAEGRGLRIWPADGVEGASAEGNPLIRLDIFRFHAPLRYEPGKTIHISTVHLKGLTLDLPPKNRFAHLNVAQKVPTQTDSLATPLAAVRFQVDSIECQSAHVTLETSKPGKLPLQAEIASLHLKLNDDGSMNFAAELTNPRPVGRIHTTGVFGRWQIPDPGETSVSGQYNFDHADLSTFRGIAGILNSTGQYKGTLRDLAVDGETHVPDFRLTHFGTPLRLDTHFHALVDATSGDTRLQSVDAMLGRSRLRASGQIVRVLVSNQSIGRDINLHVSVENGRIEDFLRLTSRSGTPLMTGAFTMETAFDLPPGNDPLHERLKLNGTFALDQVLFTSDKIQSKIGELSSRGQGHPDQAKSAAASDIRSDLHGHFILVSGVMNLPDLQYTVPGAEVALKGTYGVEGGALDFAGIAKLDATISHVVGGWKGMLLKPFDGYFKRDGSGTSVPIHIRGTREAPDFGVDLNHFKHGAQHGADPAAIH